MRTSNLLFLLFTTTNINDLIARHILLIIPLIQLRHFLGQSQQSKSMAEKSGRHKTHHRTWSTAQNLYVSTSVSISRLGSRFVWNPIHPRGFLVEATLQHFARSTQDTTLCQDQPTVRCMVCRALNFKAWLWAPYAFDPTYIISDGFDLKWLFNFLCTICDTFNLPVALVWGIPFHLMAEKLVNSVLL